MGGDFDILLFGASGSELETSKYERFWSGKIFKVATCSSKSKMSSGWKVAPRRTGVAESPEWTQGVVDLSREALCS